MSNTNTSLSVVVEAGADEQQTLLNLHTYLRANPITFLEALLLGWVAKESSEFSKSRGPEEKPLSSIIRKVGGEAELILEQNPSPYRMVLGLNYLAALKEYRGTILPPTLGGALSGGTAKVTSLVDGMPKYIATWFLGFNDHSEGVDGTTLRSGVVLAGVGETPDKDFVGDWFTADDIIRWWTLPVTTPFLDILKATATDHDSKTGAFQVMYHTWIHWDAENSMVSFTANGRTSRSTYTVNGTYSQEALTVWGNFLVQYLLGGGSKDYLSLILNKTATNLLTPSVVYGDPSPLNKAVNYNTVGHLKVELNSPDDNGCFAGLSYVNDNDAYAPAEAAYEALKGGLPVLFQHQLSQIRVGAGAAALGKSTIRPYVKVSEEAAAGNSLLKAGSLVEVPLVLGQDEVDKASKLFNRDALCVRVTPVVKTIFPANFAVDKGLASGMEDLAASLLADE